MEKIKPNSHVVIIDSSGNRRVYHIKDEGAPENKICHYKNYIDCNMLIGKGYNTFYRIEDAQKTGEISQLDDQRELVKEHFLPIEEGEDDQSEGELQLGKRERDQAKDDPAPGKKSQKVDDFEVTGDNRNIFDDREQQKLGETDIRGLRESGVDGKKIISKLIENSKTFEMKTQFSKEKWLKKKQQKYLVTFEVRKPDALELCEIYSIIYPEKICNLRPDSLSFLINMANVSALSRVLLVDNTRGFLPGVLMEKQVSHGIRLEFNTKAVKNMNEILFEFDAPSSYNKRIGTINSKLLIPENSSAALNKPDFMRDALQKKYKKFFTSFIFAHDTLHPKEVFLAIKPFLQPSASFSIFSTFLQPLVELEKALDMNSAVNVKIEELWTREYQVLPLRTHPHMTTDGKSGFILSGQVLA